MLSLRALHTAKGLLAGAQGPLPNNQGSAQRGAGM